MRDHVTALLRPLAEILDDSSVSAQERFKGVIHLLFQQAALCYLDRHGRAPNDSNGLDLAVCELMQIIAQRLKES